MKDPSSAAELTGHQSGAVLWVRLGSGPYLAWVETASKTGRTTGNDCRQVHLKVTDVSCNLSDISQRYCQLSRAVVTGERPEWKSVPLLRLLLWWVTTQHLCASFWRLEPAQSHGQWSHFCALTLKLAAVWMAREVCKAQWPWCLNPPTAMRGGGVVSETRTTWADVILNWFEAFVQVLYEIVNERKIGERQISFWLPRLRLSE